MRPPDKKRFLNAVRHIESADIPLQENDPDMSIVNSILGRDFPLSLHAYELPAPDNVERRFFGHLLFAKDQSPGGAVGSRPLAATMRLRACR